MRQNRDLRKCLCMFAYFHVFCTFAQVLRFFVLFSNIACFRARFACCCANCAKTCNSCAKTCKTCAKKRAKLAQQKSATIAQKRANCVRKCVQNLRKNAHNLRNIREHPGFWQIFTPDIRADSKTYRFPNRPPLCSSETRSETRGD